MKHEQLIKAAYFACLAVNQDPSVRTLMAMIRRIAGRGVRQEEVRLFLFDLNRDTLGTRSGHTAGRTNYAQKEPIGTHLESSPGHLRVRMVKVLRVINNNQYAPAAFATGVSPVEKKQKRRERQQSQVDLSLVPFDLPTCSLEPRDRPAPDDPNQPLWVRQMRAWIKPYFDRPLRELKPDELLKLARYHAWRWANCTVDPAKNLAAAAKIVAGIKRVADDRRHGTITVNEFILAGDDLWDRTGRRPMHHVWPLISQLEQQPGVHAA